MSKKPETNRLVVRLKTDWWSTPRGYFMRKSLTPMARMSGGAMSDLLYEDICNIGAEEALSRITNLDSAEDGLYQVVTCNESRDWETGHIDDYDYQLVPFDPAAPEPVAAKPTDTIF